MTGMLQQASQLATGTWLSAANKTMGINYDSVTCRYVHNINDSLQCAFVRNASDCDIEEGFINYTYFLYCDLTSKWTAFLVILLILWLFVLFIAMAVCADDFFCPPLVMISKTLKMSDNVAGVTLLAFGNGAADVFSAIAAIKSAKGGDIGLAVGALLGAGILLCTIIAGCIAIMTPCHMAERPFLRDVVFFIVAVFMVFVIAYDGQITLGESAGFLSIYLFYAVVVIGGRYIYQYRKNKRQGNLQAEPSDTEETVEEDNPSTPLLAPQQSRDFGATETADVEFLEGSGETHWYSPLQDFLMAISPLSLTEFKAARWYKKIYLIAKAPALFLLQLSIPIVDYSKPRNGWNRHLNAVHCLLSPLIGLLVASETAFVYRLGGKFPVYALVILIGVCLTVAVLLTSKNSQPPVYHPVFAYVAFAASVVWTNAIAGEIVNLLTTIGIISNISNAVLGLTLLAWGNSVADFVADFIMARKGYPRAGLSACYGGPLFNIMLGIGIPFVMSTAAHGTQAITFTLVQVILTISLLIVLVLTLVIVPILKFSVGKAFGIFLLAFYVLFLVMVLLAETGVIKGHWP